MTPSKKRKMGTEGPCTIILSILYVRIVIYQILSVMHFLELI
jgi:hypothetical protein